MFTGLVETVGTLRQRGNGKLIIAPGKKWDDLLYGESIAVNGCCLTLEQVSASGELCFHTLEESLRRTNLGNQRQMYRRSTRTEINDRTIMIRS